MDGKAKHLCIRVLVAVVLVATVSFAIYQVRPESLLTVPYFVAMIALLCCALLVRGTQVIRVVVLGLATLVGGVLGGEGRTAEMADVIVGALLYFLICSLVLAAIDFARHEHALRKHGDDAVE